MSNFNFKHPQIESVDLDGYKLTIKLTAQRGEIQHTITLETADGSIQCLLRKYVEACNRALETARAKHKIRKDNVATRWREFAKLDGEP